MIDRNEPEYPRVTLTHRPTGENALFRSQDLALNQVRFHRVKGDDEDLVAKLDYEFDQKVADLPVQWKVGGKFRGKDRKLDGAIDDYAPIGTAPTQNTFATDFEPRDVFDGRIRPFGPFPNLNTVFSQVAQNPNNFTFVPGDEVTLLALSRYQASEEISSGYGMGTMQVGKLQVIGGVRYEATKVDYTFRPAPTTTANGGSFLWLHAPVRAFELSLQPQSRVARRLDQHHLASRLW